ncbi:ATP-binding cassette domain-containing protein, partial [Streptomyces kanasensis]|uniref:ATP-binding cassette domain-containing protein n=1 Tax=Streptomyces kanasensis TaxID=936756 RepID=UPI000AECDD2E
MSVPVVHFQDVVKTYGTASALDGLDLEVPPGRFFGLLGPNGAGKSTTMRLITGQSRATGGTVEVLGHGMPAASRRVRSLLGVVSAGGQTFDIELTVRQKPWRFVFARFFSAPLPPAGVRRGGLDRALGGGFAPFSTEPG